MKNILMIVVFLLLPFYSFSQSAADTVNWNQLEQRDNIWYKTGSEIPCSGVIVRFWENGQLQQETQMVNGQRVGKEINWYENGQKKSEIIFKDDLPFSLKKWDQMGTRITN